MQHSANTRAFNAPVTEAVTLDKNNQPWRFTSGFSLTSSTVDAGVVTGGILSSPRIAFAGTISLSETGSEGMDMDLTGTSRLTIQGAGSVTAARAGIEAHLYGGAFTLLNQGRITAADGGESGLELYNDVTRSGTISVLNRENAVISGPGAGIAIHDDGVSITNQGTIRAASDNGNGILMLDDDPDNDVDGDPAPTKIDNSGTITGTIAGIESWGVAVQLTNSGTINGQVSLQSQGPIQDDQVVTNRGTINGMLMIGRGDDRVTNAAGTINGAISLGGGDDRFVETGGVATAAILGGDGNDVYIFRNSAADVTKVTEFAGLQEGNDTIAANGTFALADSIENGQLLGTGAFSLTGNAVGNRLVGNAGDNVIEGGKGADTLRGRSGSDTFVFQTGDSSIVADQADWIEDFATGIDKIKIGFQVQTGASSNYTEVVAADESYASILAIGNNTLANMASQPQRSVVLVTQGGSGGSSWLLIDRTGDHVADEAIWLAYVTGNQFAVQDLIA